MQISNEENVGDKTKDFISLDYGQNTQQSINP